MEGNDIDLIDVWSHTNGTNGIEIASGGARIGIARLLAYDNVGSGILAQATSNLEVRHATVAFNDVAGIDARGGATGVTILNTIMANNRERGLWVDSQASIGTLDYSDFYSNPCGECVPGPPTPARGRGLSSRPWAAGARGAAASWRPDPPRPWSGWSAGRAASAGRARRR